MNFKNILVTVVCILALPPLISVTPALAAGTATTSTLLTPEQLFRLSQEEQQRYIESVRKNPSAFAPSAPSTDQKPVTQLIADVNLQDCEYTQETSADQTFHISCNITNKFQNQGDIHYGVQLLKNPPTGSQEIIDTKVYDPMLSLRTNQTVRQQMDYTPPSYLSGQYELIGVLRTSNGLPLSTNFLGKVTLKASTSSYIEIKSGTCALRVRSDTATTTYLQGTTTVSPNETLEGSCAATAHNTGDITVTPSLITYQESIFGAVIPATKSAQNVTFKNNETKEISFIVPKASTPQLYVATLSLVTSSGAIVSNKVAMQYVVRGPSATIQNTLLDKDYYTAGDTAQVSVFWTGSVSFTGTGDSQPDFDAKNIVISIKNDSDAFCARETTFALPNDAMERSILKAYSLPVTRLCINPQATIKIVDAAGAVLGQKTVALASGQVPESAMQASLSRKWAVQYGVIILALLIATGVFLYMRKKNSVV